MASLGTAQAKARSTLDSAVASNPGSSVVVESEIHYTSDPYTGTEVISESTRTIVVDSNPSDSLFVFPPSADFEPDFDDSPGGASQFVYEDISKALADTVAGIKSADDVSQSLDIDFNQSFEEALALELEGVSKILVNSQEQLDLVAEVMPLLDNKVGVSIITNGDFSVPLKLEGITTTLTELQEVQREETLLLEQESADLDIDRNLLLQELEDAGELEFLNQYVQQAKPDFNEGILEAGLAEELAVFDGLKLPVHEMTVSASLSNGGITEQLVGEDIHSLSEEVIGKNDSGVSLPTYIVARQQEIDERVKELAASLEMNNKSTTGTIFDSAVMSTDNNYASATPELEIEVEPAVAARLDALASATSESFVDDSASLENKPEILTSELTAQDYEIAGAFFSTNPEVAELRQQLGLTEPQVTDTRKSDLSTAEQKVNKPKISNSDVATKQAVNDIRKTAKAAIDKSLDTQKLQAA